LRKKQESLTRNLIQTQLFIEIEKYRELVKRNNVSPELLEIFYKQYGDRCPLCGKRDCLKFIGTYKRRVHHIKDEVDHYYPEYKIARFLCSEKHLTMSLLPAGIIPYRLYTISFITTVLLWYLLDKKHLPKIDTMITGKSTPDGFMLIPRTIKMFIKYLAIAINIYSVIAKDNRFKNVPLKDGVVLFIQYMNSYKNNKIRGPTGFSFDFYFKRGNYKKQARFLFGTPSQYRMNRAK